LDEMFAVSQFNFFMLVTCTVDEKHVETNSSNWKDETFLGRSVTVWILYILVTRSMGINGGRKLLGENVSVFKRATTQLAEITLWMFGLYLIFWVEPLGSFRGWPNKLTSLGGHTSQGQNVWEIVSLGLNVRLKLSSNRRESPLCGTAQ
jgi:hypothetical protein